MSVLALLFAAIPNVTADPEILERLSPIELPIVEVTVYGDRARIRRRAKIELPAGVKAVRLPDLPGALIGGTLRAEAEGGRILRLESHTLGAETMSSTEVDELLGKLDVIGDALAKIDAKVRAVDQELSYLGALQPAPPVPEAAREGRPAPALDPTVLARGADFLAAERRRLLERRLALGEERLEKGQAYEALQADIARRDLGVSQRVRIGAVAWIEAPAAGALPLELEYFVFGAAWTPSYELRYSAKDGKVELLSAGQVRQSTGEEWTSVALQLSTAIPGQSIALPQLKTWTLGEAKQFVPVPVARATPAPPVRPLGGAESARRERETEAKLQVLSGKIADLRARAGAPGAPPPPPPPSPKPFALTPPRSSAPSLEMQRSAPSEAKSMDFADEELSAPVSITSAGESAGAVSYQRRRLSLFESTSPASTIGDPNSPTVTAGGLDYVWDAAAAMTVNAAGDAVKAPLGVEVFDVDTYYEISPGLQPVGYLRATVANKGKRPILAGPATLYVGPDLAGEAWLQTTGPGGKIQLPLGADEDVRSTRRTLPATTREGVFSKDDVTTYRVEIEVTSYKKKPITVEIHEPLPRSETSKITVEGFSAEPPAKPDDFGTVTWRIQVQPGKVGKVALNYKIRRPADWRLQQY